ncbi:hypothetical protein [Actinomadura parmotrematis]|uniref:Mce-associated membrane protein n=1 Tax=Actinomadura parmotrematis TaxID=2864039 RepID=A0ABS7G1S6_9ACTN|nr:hypothetical protein [Actinomadura parmotrematis]MBW8486667.1 hypothetical protein [Actinomadura parmotrematis]
MTAKITKDVTGGEDAPEEVAAEQGAADEETPAPAPAARKRKRRVRVIEVIEDDDEDLDDVLEALDAEEAEDEAEEEPAPAPRPKPKPRAAAVKTAPKPKPKPRIEPTPEPAEDDEDADPPARRLVLGIPAGTAAALVVALAVLATLAVWQWRTAAGLQSDKDDRAAVAKVAAAYGDIAATYNAANYQQQMTKAQRLMGGDLLEKYKSTTVPNLANAFKSNPNAALTSKTVAVAVGDVDGRFASAVVTVDISGTSQQGTSKVPANLIRLALAKIDGKWKVTKQYASGEDDATQAQNASGGAVPGVSTSPSASPSAKASPKN